VGIAAAVWPFSDERGVRLFRWRIDRLGSGMLLLDIVERPHLLASKDGWVVEPGREPEAAELRQGRSEQPKSASLCPFQRFQT
jgi:hypothetical protein